MRKVHVFGASAGITFIALDSGSYRFVWRTIKTYTNLYLHDGSENRVEASNMYSKVKKT